MKKILAILLVFMVMACSKEPETETNTYHVWLVNKKGQTIYSGKVIGLSSCQYIAKHRIRSQRDNPGWDYYCCWEKDGNECYQKDH